MVPALLFYPQRIRVTPAHVTGGAFVAWCALGYFWSASPYDTEQWLFRLLLLSGAFCLASMVKDIRLIAIGFAIGLIPSAQLAIWQYLGWDGLLQVAAPSGLYANKNFYAEICALVAVALISERLWLWVIPVAPGLLLTGARGALLACAAAVAVMAWRRKASTRGALLGLVALTGVLIVVSMLHKGDASIVIRWELWKSAVQYITVFGYGLGTFSEEVPKMASMLAEHPHNEILEYGFDTGLIGLVLLGLFGLSLARGGLKTESFVLIAFFVEGLFEFPSRNPATAFMGACAAGALAGRIDWSIDAAWDGGKRICQGQIREGFRQVISSFHQGAPSLPV